MKQYLLTTLLIFSVGNLSANDKKVVVKKMAVSTDQDEKNVDVNAEIENNILTLTIKQSGEENVFKINLQDEDALQALKEELQNLAVDVNIMALIGESADDVIIIDDDHDSFHSGRESGGFLGVRLQDLTDPLRDYFKVKGDGGVLVSEVVKDSPAEKAGLEAGDVITKVNNVYISDAGELTHTIRKQSPESAAEITVVRKGREKSLKAVLGSSNDKFAWHPKGLQKKAYKYLNKSLKKYKHVCTEECEEKCPLEGKLDLDLDWGEITPEKLEEHKNYKFHLKLDYEDDLEKLKKDVEKLREELKKLNDS